MSLGDAKGEPCHGGGSNLARSLRGSGVAQAHTGRLPGSRRAEPCDRRLRVEEWRTFPMIRELYKQGCPLATHAYQEDNVR